VLFTFEGNVAFTFAGTSHSPKKEMTHPSFSTHILLMGNAWLYILAGGILPELLLILRYHLSNSMSSLFLFRPAPDSSRHPEPSRSGRAHPVSRPREPSRRRRPKRILHLGALCSPPLDSSVRNFAFSDIQDAIVSAQHHPSVVAVIGDVRSDTVSYAAPSFFVS